MISFPRVPEVEPGDPVTSSQLAGLADGINARIVSGLGDCAWRIAYYYASLARQFRVMGQTDMEFFHSIQMLEEPLNLPLVGSIGGVSTSSPLGLYVHGQGTFPSEVDAYDVPMATVTDAEQAWELAKQQRGAFNPETEEWAAPAFDAARHAFRIVYSGTSIYGNAYGGFIPVPGLKLDGSGNPISCGDATSETPESLNLSIFFTNTATNATQTFDGTCPSEPTHIAGIWQTPLAFWVALNDGTLYYLDRSVWIEGPYTEGNALRKTYSEHLPRVLNAFAGEFRGDTARVEKEDDGKASWLGKAFDIRSFLTRPYYLAPARGYTINDEVVPQYTQGSRSGSTVSGVIGSHTAQAGCWFACAIVRLTGTIQTAIVTFFSGGRAIGSETVSGPIGSALVMFTEGAESVEVFVSSVSGSSVTVSYEIAETFAYRPGVHDLWALLRLAGANSASDIDGSGRSIANANDIWAAYRDQGVIPKLGGDNELPPMEDRQIDTNAVFDKFRRLSRVVRCLHPSQVAGYAVEDGNSILYVRPRYQSIVGNAECDILAGIRDAIAAEAEPGGYTNEWCAFPRFAAYHPSPTSDWDQTAYAEYWSTSDRCAFYASPFSNVELRRHFNANFPDAVNKFLAPEAATGYRYSKSLNSTATEPFYKSCRLYEPPLKITSAETVTIDGEEQVKITFDGRFHHHDTLAPASIDRDISTWDLTALLAEEQDYRTDENAIRAYLAWKDDTSRNCERTGPGNAAAGSSVQLLPDNPYGTCFPHIWLVQLLPKPYDDGNERQDRHDTPIRHDVMLQAETYIRAMCEGFVDGQTSKDYGCAVGVMAVFDYTFANLCFDAFGGTSITTMPTVETDALDADEVRTDSPIGYGPLPTVRLSAEQWNQFAKAVNKLTRVRVSLPFQFEVQNYEEETDFRFVSGVRADGTAADCAAGGRGWRSQFAGGGSTPTIQTATWFATSTMSASNTIQYTIGTGYTCSASGSGPLYEVYNLTQEHEYRFTFVDPDAEYAIPETWRDMLETNGEMVWARTYSLQIEEHAVVPHADATLCGGLIGWEVSATEGWEVTPVEGLGESSCEILPMTGRLSFPVVDTATLYGAQQAGVECATPIIASEVYEPVVSDALILSVPFEDDVEN